MNVTKILSRGHSATRFEIYQTDNVLCLRCYDCRFWLTDTEFNYGWIEIKGCRCAERRVKVGDMLRDAGITVTEYGSTGEYRDQYLQFIKNLTAPHFFLDDLLNGKNVEDVSILYQWIAFWTGNDVWNLELNYSVTQ